MVKIHVQSVYKAIRLQIHVYCHYCEYRFGMFPLTWLHSEQPKRHRVLAVLSAIRLKMRTFGLINYVVFSLQDQ